MEEVLDVLEEPVYVEVQGRISDTGQSDGSARVEYDPETNSVFVRIDYDNSKYWSELSIPWKTLIQVKKTTEEEVEQEMLDEVTGNDGCDGGCDEMEQSE